MTSWDYKAQILSGELWIHRHSGPLQGWGPVVHKNIMTRGQHGAHTYFTGCLIRIRKGGRGSKSYKAAFEVCSSALEKEIYQMGEVQ